MDNNIDETQHKGTNKRIRPLRKRKKGRREEKFDKNIVKLPLTQRILLETLIIDFRHSYEEKLVLKDLSTEERKYLHSYILKQGLQSRSYGDKNNRIMHIWWKNGMKPQKDQLELLPETRELLVSQIPMLEEKFLGDKEESVQRYGRLAQRQRKGGTLMFDVLGKQMVPPEKKTTAQLDLPICKYRQEILDMIKQHNVLIISGETGSGKTSQVPQFILEQSTKDKVPCRIFVTQPRRIAAISLAQRVADERDEQVGGTVGYKMQWENCLSRKTNLIYVTSGSFLRLIMSNPGDLARKTTHLILDEIHERDYRTDFGMIIIKDQLRRFKHLKVILMSATMDIASLSKYFDNCPVIEVPGRSYGVKIYHLEDILYHTGYTNKLMELYLRDMKETATAKESNDWNDKTDLTSNQQPVLLEDTSLQLIIDSLLTNCMNINTKEIHECINDSFDKNNKDMDEIRDMFDQILYYIESEDVSVNVGHSDHGSTPLMLACKCNLPEYVRLFIEQHNAAITLMNKYNCTALDYAKQHEDSLCLEIIQNNLKEGQYLAEEKIVNDLETEKQRILIAYQSSITDENKIDHYLILSLLEGLYRTNHSGSIMVFLPGYSDIMQQKNLIESTLPVGTYCIYIMHGQISMKQQAEVFMESSMQQRKIILSTNIGQTSITVPDLAFVIDSGKAKMNTFDCLTESSKLQTIWISQADANQRAGRAGRTQNGVCYRLYSSQRYLMMAKFCIPEFMRIPLTELCLFAKVFEGNSKIETVLSKALNPPSTLNVQNAVKKLKLLGALHEDETITYLGRYLADIPLDIQLGICLLYGVFYCCIDPIITICAYHSVKDPFVLTTANPYETKTTTPFEQKTLCGNRLSDEMGILNLYETYLKVRGKNQELNDLCTNYCLSASAMEVFYNTRIQLSNILREKFQIKAIHRKYNNNWRMIQFCLIAGFYPNVANIDRTDFTLSNGSNKKLIIHKKSILSPGKNCLKKFITSLPHDWIIFYEKVRLNNSCCINWNTLVPSFLIALQCGLQCTLTYRNADQRKNVNLPNEIDFSLDNENDLMVENDSDSIESDLQDDLNNLFIGDKSEEEVPLICQLSIDNWIKFELVTTTDAELLMRFRRLLKDSFRKSFLMIFKQRNKNRPTTKKLPNIDYVAIADFLAKVFETIPSSESKKEISGHSSK